MSLKLNSRPEKYKEFYGPNIGQMPKLISEGRVPMNVAQLMQKRLNVRNSSEDVKESWINNYFDTGDAVAYHPDGRIKIVLDSKILREINSYSLGNYGALVLTEDIYNALDGEEFKEEKLGKLRDLLSKKEVKTHPVWRILARDQALLNDYADYFFAESGYDAAMAIYHGATYESTPEIRSWLIDGFIYRSDMFGNHNLDDNGGRFIGLAQKDLNKSCRCQKF